MDSVKQKIVDKLERLPDSTLQEILNFVDFLEWRKGTGEDFFSSQITDKLQEESDEEWLESDLSNLGSYESYDWQPGEMDEGLPVKYVPGVGVVIVRE